jgi:threonine/homoserine/homoserine lactone efflux protein
MPEGAAVAAFVPVAFLLVLTPGATTAVVVRHALAGGRRAGAATAVGAAVGNSTQAAAAAGGLALLLQRAPALLGAVHVVGACYLAWLGLRSLAHARRATARPVAAPVGAAASHRSSLTDGFVVTLLNPSTLTFYLVIVPGFIRPPGGLGAFGLLAVIHVAMAFSCHLAWALALDRVRGAFSRPGARQALDVAAGLALIALAAQMVWTP